MQQTPAFTALLVDYGGVLTTSIADSFRAFCRDEGIDTDVFRRAVFGDMTTEASPIARFETGEITAHEFDRLLASRLSDGARRPIDPAGLKGRMFARVRPDEPMQAAVRAARAAGIRTVLVSNSWGDDYPMEALEPLFDAMLISGRIGLRKPDAPIYRAAAEAAGADPAGCVFVDDLAHNIEGAEKVGMHGVLHREAGPTIERLESLLGCSLRA